jgi:hypothetical protein
MQLLTLPTFVLTCLLAMARPAWCYAFVVCFYCIEMTLQASVGIFLSNQFLGNFIFAGVVGVAALRQALAAPTGTLGSYLNLGLGSIVLLLSWTIVTMLWSPSGEQGETFIREGIPYMMIYLFAAPMLIDSVESMRRAYLTLLVLGTVTALLILVNPEFGLRGGRIAFRFGTVDVTNVLSIGRLGGTLMIVAAVLRVDGKGILPMRVAAFVIGTLLAFFSGSRGQVVAAALFAALFFPVARPLRSVRAFAALIAALLIGYLGVTIVADYVLGVSDINRWDAKYVTGAFLVRLANVTDLFGGFLSTPYAPFVGLGYNAFSVITGAREDTYVHNIFIEVLCELGIPMFALLVVLLYLTLVRGWRLFVDASPSPALRATVATLLALTAYDLLIAQKEGQVWNHFVLYMHICLIHRLYSLQAAGIGLPEPAEAPAELSDALGHPAR